VKESKDKAKELADVYWEKLYFLQSRVIPDELLEQSKQCALICIDKQLELLRYLGKKTPEELYQDLIKQKVALK